MDIKALFERRAMKAEERAAFARTAEERKNWTDIAAEYRSVAKDIATHQARSLGAGSD
jgi:predicted membrane chloride channel (bestrophin family)